MTALPIFHRKDDIFLTYKEKLISAAKDTHVANSHGQGMLAFLLSDADFTALPFQAGIPAPVRFEPFAPPGDQSHPYNQNFTADFAIWKFNSEFFETQQMTLSKFRTVFLNSLSDSVKLRIGMPTNGIDSLTIRQIYTLLLSNFSSLSTFQVTN